MFRKIDTAQVEEARRLGDLGLTSYAIASQVGVHSTTVQRWLGVNAARGPRGRIDVTDERIRCLRDRECLSFAEIGRRTGMSKTGARMRYYALTGRPRPDRCGEPD